MTYQYYIICPSKYPSTLCTTGNTSVDYDFSHLGDAIMNFTIFMPFNLMLVKRCDTKFKK